MKISNKKQGEIPVYRMKKEDFLNIEVFVTKKYPPEWLILRQQQEKSFSEQLKLW